MKIYTVILVGALAAIALMTFTILSIGTKKEEKALLNAAPVIKADGIEAKTMSGANTIRVNTIPGKRRRQALRSKT